MYFGEIDKETGKISKDTCVWAPGTICSVATVGQCCGRYEEVMGLGSLDARLWARRPRYIPLPNRLTTIEE